MPELNRELLEATLHHIEDHPQEWNQGVYFTSRYFSTPAGTTRYDYWDGQSFCGSAACFAGRAILLAGKLKEYKTNVQSEPVDIFAAQLLGIPFRDACVLFHPDNTLQDLQQMIKDLLNGESLSSPSLLFDGR